MALDMHSTNYFTFEFVDSLRKHIAVIKTNSTTVAPHKWLQRNREELDNLLLRHGGVLLRGFDISSISEFQEFTNLISPHLLEYEYGSTPRKKLGNGIYTATEYPPGRVIPMHNEHSYAHNWPRIIIFYCMVSPEQGGETPLTDSRLIYQRIDKSIVKDFERYGVLYLRNYIKGVDLSWQEVFQTSNKQDVERYCKTHEIDYEWLGCGDSLTTRQVSQATLLHPVLGDKVWFNQVHLFHESNIDNEHKDYILSTTGGKLTRNSYYGNGAPIEDAVISHIQEVYQDQMITFQWHKGDILLLDNVLTAHGRMPFVGARKILVSML